MDTERGTCDEPYKTDLTFTNIKLDNISAAIEFNQIGLSENKLFIHHLDYSSASLVSSLRENAAVHICFILLFLLDIYYIGTGSRT